MAEISVIVPVYNVGKYVGKCIESIQKQTFIDWELILVDDCSRDESLKIIRDYEQKDNRIRVLALDHNKGPMYAREQGCKMSTGEYVTFCDGDDQLSINALALFINTAKTENADIVIGQIQVFNGNIKRTFMPYKPLLYGDDKIGVMKSILRYDIHQGLCGKCFHRSLIHQEMKILEHVTNGEDASVLFQYLCKSHKTVLIKDFVYQYWIRQGSSTQRMLSEQALEGICKLTKLRETLLLQYQDLNEDFNRYVINNIVGFYPRYKRTSHLLEFIKNNEIEGYLLNSNILRCYGRKKGLRYIIMKDIYPYTYNIYMFFITPLLKLKKYLRDSFYYR